MTSLPSGLASISSQFDDFPQVRGAVDMARRIRRADALSRLAEMDAPLIGGGTEFVTLQDLEIRESDDGTTVMRKFRASMAYAKAAAAACRQADEGVNYEPLTSAIDRHAALVIGSCYDGTDRRA